MRPEAVLLLLGMLGHGACAARRPQPAETLSPQESTQDFLVTYTGAAVGYGEDCMSPRTLRHTHWTAFFVVTDSLDSHLDVGQKLCRFVHSPSMELGAFKKDTRCRVAAGSEPPRWACGRGVPPDFVATPQWTKETLRREAQEDQQRREAAFAPLLQKVAELREYTQTHARCLAERHRDTLDETRRLLETVQEVLPSLHENGVEDVLAFVDANLARMRAALSDCGVLDSPP